MKKLLHVFCSYLIAIILLAFPTFVKAEVILSEEFAVSVSCAELIDVPDDLCESDRMLTPLITCPTDRYLTCLTYTGNPSDYGQPIVNGHWQNVTIVEHPVEDYTNQCGIGYIIRRWTIYTSVGTFTCTQKITISGGGSFGYYDINWPLDYVINNQCYANVHPNDLPPPYNKPTWNHRPCSMIGISYKDDIFYFGEPYGSAGCRKILRTWKVIDWCQYIPNTNIGIWTKVQVIKLDDTRAPEFVFCPGDVVFGVNDNCAGAFVNVPIPIALDNCNANPRIRNNSSYSIQKNSDASGFYPIGTTIVRFVADDGCGNYDTCFTRVTVRDLKKPTPICYHGLTANLMPMGDDGFIRLNGKIFDAGSYDNCTPNSRLRFDLVPNEFTCADRGRNEVRMIVTDESGNTDFCITYVIIQDNMGMCPPDTTGGIISGLVSYFGGQSLSEVAVYAIEANKEMNDMTDDAGVYVLDKLVEGKDYKVKADKTGNLSEGLSTLDIIILRKHITGEQLLDDPYRIIAGDINRDGKLDIRDVNQLQLILMLGLEQFPGMKPWRFVDKAYDFEDPTNPLAEPFTEVYSISNHTKADMKIDFIGVKIGDMDGSFMEVEEEEDVEGKDNRFNTSFANVSSRSKDTYRLLLDDQVFINNDLVTMDLRVSDSWLSAGAQFTLKFDSYLLNFVGFEADENSPFKNIVIGEQFVEDGMIHFSWDNTDGSSVEALSSLGNLHFSARSSGRISEAMEMSSKILKPEVYQFDLSTHKLGLEFVPVSQNTTFDPISMFSAYPNPFNQFCTMEFNANMETEYAIQVSDVTGKAVYLKNGLSVNGRNTEIISNTMLPGSGVYFVSLITEHGSKVRKLIYID